MKKLFLPSFVLALFSCGAFAASDVSYNFATLQYITEDIDADNFSCTQDGLTLSGNLDIDTNIFALGSFTDVSGDNGCGSQTYSIGAGYKADFSEDGSYYASLSYGNTDVDFGDGDSGLIAAIGARAMFTIDLEGRIELSRYTAFDGNTVLSAGLSYWVADRISFHGDVNLGSESTGIAAGVRVDF